MVALLTLFAVLASSVVMAVIGDSALGWMNLTEFSNNNIGGEDDLRQRLQLDTLPSQGVAVVGVTMAVARITPAQPVPPGGEEAGAAELTRGPCVTLGTLADLDTEGRVLSLVS